MQLNTNCPHCWKQLFHWFCSTMNLNATLVLAVLGEYLIFVNIHYWFQFFKHFRIREPPVPVLWGKIWTKELEHKHCNTGVEWVFDFADNRQFQFFKHLEPENCEFWFFGKQLRIKELQVPVISETSTNKWVSGTGGYEPDIFTGFFKHAELAVSWFTNSCKTQNWGFFDSAVKERKKP